MKTLLIACLFAIFSIAPATAQERIDLSQPDQAAPGTFAYQPAQLVFDYEHGRIVVRMRGENGERREFVFGDAENARTMLRALNKADLSNNSLLRRIMKRLVDDGHLDGTVAE